MLTNFVDKCKIAFLMRWSRGALFVLLAVLGVLAAQGCAKTNRQEEPAKVAFSPASTDCQKFIASLPADVSHGFLEVPENYADPDGLKTKVFYYGRLGRGGMPVIFFNGGPASSSHDSYKVFEMQREAYALAAEKALVSTLESFLYIDQRGTGCSSPYPDRDEKDGNAVPRLAYYGTREIVRDAETLRRKLFGEKSRWIVFGQSFGALLAKRYVELAPEGLHAVFAHGYSLTTDLTEWMVERISAQHANVSRYFKENPAVEKRFLAFRRAVGPDVCLRRDGEEICGREITHLAKYFTFFSSDMQYLARWLEVLIDENGKLDRARLEEFAEKHVFSVIWSFHPGDVINWIDRGYDLTMSFWDAYRCAEAFERLRARGKNPDAWPLHECMEWRNYPVIESGYPEDLAQEHEPIVAYFRSIPRDEFTLARFHRAALRHPEIPIYLYAGAKDQVVPSSTFKEEAELLGDRIKFKIFPNSGHEGYHTELELIHGIIAERARAAHK